MAPLTFRDELIAIRARLKALDREFNDHTAWLGIAANEIGDALKEIPRAELGRRLPDAPSALDERRGPVRAEPASKTLAGAAGTGVAGSNPAGSLETGSRSSEVRAPATVSPPRETTAPQSTRNPCRVCGGTDHDGRRHRYEGKRAADATPAEAPASDDEDPEPARAERPLRHFLAAPDAGEGLARCGALGESVRVVGKLSMATCPECLRLMGARCTRCNELGHTMRRCPLKGDKGVATLRAYRAEEAAKRAAVLEQPLEVIETQPAPVPAEDLPTPSPGRGELLADQRGGVTDEPVAPPPSAFADLTPASEARVKHEGSVCQKEQVARSGGWDRSETLPDAFPDHLVAELPPAMRAIWEAVTSGRTLEAVALERGRSRSTVYQQLVSARGRLRALAREMAQGPTLVTPPTPVSLVPVPGADPTPMQARLRSKLRVVNGRVRAKTVSASGPLTGHLMRDERAAGEGIEYPDDVERPTARHECGQMHRPCPFVSCSHHLYLDVNPETGSLKFNFPHLEVWEMAETCSLDVADRGGITLEEVGGILNLTRERIRQVEVRGLAKIKDHTGDELGLPPEHRGSPLGEAMD